MTVRILEIMSREGFEEVTALTDQASGLRAFVGIHDTRRGPAFGGTRRWSYLDESHALDDCLRLSRAMTYKCALSDLPAGGAKIVMLDGPEMDPRGAYRALGAAVERMGGRFYTGPDVGTGEQELGWIAERTSFVTHPGSKGPGLLADATATGVLAGMEAALLQLDGALDWPQRTVVVQGLGGVGGRVARGLVERGARVLAAEIDRERAQAAAAEIDLELIDPTGEFDPPCDIFAPCALGGILHDLTIQRLHCRIVAGGANNVLASPDHAEQLHERGILYVPDVIINSGALIRGATFHMEGRRLPLEAIGERIGAVAAQILATAAAEDLPPAEVAVREAESRIVSAGQSQGADRGDAAPYLRP